MCRPLPAQLQPHETDRQSALKGSAVARGRRTRAPAMAREHVLETARTFGHAGQQRVFGDHGMIGASLGCPGIGAMLTRLCRASCRAVFLTSWAQGTLDGRTAVSACPAGA